MKKIPDYNEIKEAEAELRKIEALEYVKNQKQIFFSKFFRNAPPEWWTKNGASARPPKKTVEINWK